MKLQYIQKLSSEYPMSSSALKSEHGLAIINTNPTSPMPCEQCTQNHDAMTYYQSRLWKSVRKYFYADTTVRTFPQRILTFPSLEDGAFLLSFSDVPSEIHVFQKISRLNLSQNRLTDLPEELGHLSTLTCLHLDHNNLSSLPSSFRQLTNLHRLILTKNNFQDFPESLPALSQLKELILGYNHLQRIPPEITNLSQLESLRLHGNMLEDFPYDLNLFPNLRYLNLRQNHFTRVPDTFHVPHRPSINLFHNNIPQYEYKRLIQDHLNIHLDSRIEE